MGVNFNNAAVTPEMLRVAHLVQLEMIDALMRVRPANRETSIAVEGGTLVCGMRNEYFNIERTLEQIETVVGELCHALNDFLFSALRAENDYLTSDEIIIETIHANGYFFRGNGDMEAN